MKKFILKGIVIVAIVATGFYNLTISTGNRSGLELSLVAGSASADPEEDEKDYDQKIETSGHSEDTITREGLPDCTRSFDYESVNCMGKGSLKCEDSYEISNYETNCE